MVSRPWIVGGGLAITVAVAVAVMRAPRGRPPPPRGEPSRVARAATPLCKHRQLALSDRLGAPAMGNTYLVYVLRNRSRSACTIGGTPRLAMVHAGARPSAAPRIVVHLLRAPKIQWLTLKPGAAASFSVDAQACAFDPQIALSTPTTTRITLPGQSEPFSFTSPASTQCAQQALVVGAIAAARSTPARRAGAARWGAVRR